MWSPSHEGTATLWMYSFGGDMWETLLCSGAHAQWWDTSPDPHNVPAWTITSEWWRANEGSMEGVGGWTNKTLRCMFAYWRICSCCIHIHEHTHLKHFRQAGVSSKPPSQTLQLQLPAWSIAQHNAVAVVFVRVTSLAWVTSQFQVCVIMYMYNGQLLAMCAALVQRLSQTGNQGKNTYIYMYMYMCTYMRRSKSGLYTYMQYTHIYSITFAYINSETQKDKTTHNTPYHNTPHHSTTLHTTTPHNTTLHHTTTLHTAPQHSTPHHNTT